ncbi:MAG: hypothetical protein H6631_06170 [Anaerolineaceae bacterium]|nr:hypothetical protein [Anaerolineaceae bacterium]MCB9100343.1 hypothetical protein [Anaerolineales bacterium]
MSLSKRMVDVNEPNLTLAELQWSLERLRDKSATPDQSVSNALHKDVWIYRIVVITLGLAVLISLVGALVLALYGKGQSSEAIVAIGSAAVGAMAGLLVPSPRDK